MKHTRLIQMITVLCFVLLISGFVFLQIRKSDQTTKENTPSGTDKPSDVQTTTSDSIVSVQSFYIDESMPSSKSMLIEWPQQLPNISFYFRLYSYLVDYSK